MPLWVCLRQWVGMVQGLIDGRRGLRWARVLRRLLGVSDTIWVMARRFFFFSESSFCGGLRRLSARQLMIWVWGSVITRVNGGFCCFFWNLHWIVIVHCCAFMCFLIFGLKYCFASRVKHGCCHLCFWMKGIIIDVIKATSLLDGFLLLYQSIRYKFADNCSFRFLSLK